MAKNQGKSENLQIAMHRLDSLLQEGFSREKLANMAEIKYGTLGKIIRGCSKNISDTNYDKIEKLYFGYLDKRYADKIQIEDILDEKDAEEGAKEMASYLTLITAIIVVLIIGMVAIIRYIVGLF
jgi:hypothetical protein